MIVLQKEPIKGGLDILADTVKLNTSSMPILSHVLVEYHDGMLLMSTTNLDQSATVEQKIEGAKDFKIVLPFNTFRQLVSSSPSMEFSIDPKGNKAQFVSGSFSAILPMWPEPEDFPSVPKTTGEKTEFEYTHFEPAMLAALQSMSDDEARFVMNGVYIHQQDHRTAIVSTDGRWLTVEKIPFTGGGDFKHIVPAAAARSLVGKDIGRISMFSGERNVSFQYHTGSDITVTLHTKVIEATFPAYTSVIPKEKRKFCSVNAARMENILKRLKVMTKTGGKNDISSVKIEVQGTSIILKVENSEQSAWEPIECNGEHYEVSCALNINYMIETLHVLKSRNEEVSFSFENLGPTVVKTPEREFQRIIMPIRLN